MLPFLRMYLYVFTNILSLIVLINTVDRIGIMNLSVCIASGTIWLRSEDQDSATASMMLYPIVGKVRLLSDARPVRKIHFNVDQNTLELAAEDEAQVFCFVSFNLQ
jgi:hypothetical protein